MKFWVGSILLLHDIMLFKYVMEDLTIIAVYGIIGADHTLVSMRGIFTFYLFIMMTKFQMLSEDNLLYIDYQLLGVFK